MGEYSYENEWEVASGNPFGENASTAGFDIIECNHFSKKGLLIAVGNGQDSEHNNIWYLKGDISQFDWLPASGNPFGQDTGYSVVETFDGKLIAVGKGTNSNNICTSIDGENWIDVEQDEQPFSDSGGFYIMETKFKKNLIAIGYYNQSKIWYKK